MSNINKAQIAQTVATPIGFFSLVVLVIETILGGLAFISSPENQTFIIRSMIYILVFVIIIVTTLAYKKPEFFNQKSLNKTLKEPLSYNYDIFLSSPMASFTGEEYIRERQQMLELIRSFSDHCQFHRIFYAGSQLERQEDFKTDIALAADHDFEAINKSKYFILIYPQRLASSVLVEAGYAIAHNKPSLIFVKNRQDLPYLLANLHGIRNVEIYEYNTLEDIKNMIAKNGCEIFKTIG